MKAIERLFSAASAHGIDLKQAAGESANAYGAGAPRRRQLMRTLAGLEAAEDRDKRERRENRERMPESVKGKQSRVARPKLHSHAELGQALAGQIREPGEPPRGGLEGPAFLAAMYSFGLDASVYEDLYRELRYAMADLAKRDSWPVEIAGLSGEPVHYGDELCRLVLVHDWCQPIFARIPGLYAIYLGVTEEVWRGKLMSPYTATQGRYERWLARARGYIDHRIYEYLHEDDGESAPQARRRVLDKSTAAA
jgi:hypothetical protein